MWTDDPVRDSIVYQNEQEAWLRKRPVCVKCNEHIQDEDAYDIGGELYCEDCAKDWLYECRVSVEHLMTWG